MKYAFVDFRISEEEFLNLSKLNCNIIKCEPCMKLYEAICGHPDILLHFIDNKNVIIHKDTSKEFENQLSMLNLTVLRSEKSLTDKYPEDIILNGVNTSTDFIHSITNTDPLLLKTMEGKNLINVKQGYSKCSTVVVNDKAFITSDKSINKALSAQGYDVLLLPPGNIQLPGLNHGFIGGTCGMITHDTLIFYGSLEHHPQGNQIKAFLSKYNVKPVYLSDSPLIDRGSIFFLDI